MSRVFAGMAASLDGYIASASGDLAWLNDAMERGEDYRFAETMKRTGAYVVGANTYREMSGFGGGGADATPTFVVTHQTDLPSQGDHVHYHSGDLTALVDGLKAETDKDICLFGGGDLLTQFLDLDLLDELTLSIVPVLLGRGVRFVGELSGSTKLRLVECQRFDRSGIVLLTYELASSA